tara:strand:- start:439 stop:738 length:300 start_codon:yes stop_codon:yes gene_type:complete
LVAAWKRFKLLGLLVIEFSPSQSSSDYPTLQRRTFSLEIVNINKVTMSASENLSPAILRKIMKEMQVLSQKPPEGIKVTIPEQNLTEIHAIIEGPGTCT